MGNPPRDVPEGLTALEYFELGKQYKSMGWTEQARDALMLALEDDSDKETVLSARRFLKTKIPRFPVPLFAEQKNIEGFNFLMNGEIDSARAIFEDLIEQFPDFEWPYGNLAVLYLHDNNSSQISKAKELLERALKINPDYVNGWLHMATAKGLELDLDGARDCVERALEADPTDAAAKAMREALDDIK